MEMTNLQLCFKIYATVMFGSKSILRLLAVLTHHNNGSLYSSKARKDEVEKDEWIWVEGALNKNHGIYGNP